MKFDFAIGNPPYQETQEGTSDKPVYNFFVDAASQVADKTELITPARFLFNAGKTPKEWNEKVLQDKHFKVLEFNSDANSVFPNVTFTGGIAISYIDKSNSFVPIGVFTVFPTLNSILKKVKEKTSEFLDSVVYAPESYKFTEALHSDNPDIESLLSAGHKYDVVTNIFDKLFNIVFFREKPADRKKYVKFYGRLDNQRVSLWILKKYISNVINFENYKVFLPKSNGSNPLSNDSSTPVIGIPFIGGPFEGHTQTFLSIGNFSTSYEATSCLKYIKTKFLRCLVSVLKVTQDNKKAVWKYVPLQDFTNNSDIDWSKSIKEIDQQLYKKYGLTDEEINFVETKVKEME